MNLPACLEQQIFHWQAVLQGHIQAGFFAVAHASGKNMEKAASLLNATVILQAHEFVAIDLNAVALEPVQG